MRKKYGLIPVLCLGVLLGLSGVASAATLAYDNFYNGMAPLVGQVGGAGFTSPWADGGLPTAWTSGLSYPDYVGGGAGSYGLSIVNNGYWGTVARAVSSTEPTLYYSYLIDYHFDPAAPGDGVIGWNVLGYGSQLFSANYGGNTDTWSVYSNGVVDSGVIITPNTTHLVVVKINKDPYGFADNTLVYVDPNLSAGEGANTPIMNFNNAVYGDPTQLGMQQYGSGKSATFGGIRVQTAWDDLIGVPPGATAEWAFNRSGNWNDASNWTADTPNGVDAKATMRNVNSGPKLAYTEDAPITLGTLTFDSAQTYAITGVGPNAKLVMEVSAGHATIDVLQGQQEINLPLVIASDTVVDLAFGTSLTISDPLTINLGKSLTQTGSGSLIIDTGSVTVGAGSSLTASSIVANTLSIGGTPVQAVPEPGTLMLMALGLSLGIAWRLRKK